MKQVSIIVPVYNTESFLCECINSVLKQSFQEWELILVDDGSSDGSGLICDSYAKSDKRIVVIHKSNSGVSETRNLALDIVTGKYIIFLDADDYWYENTALEKLVTIAERYQLDLVRGEYKAVDSRGNDLFEREVSRLRKRYACRVLDSSLFMEYAIHGEFFLVLTLIKSDVIKDIRFDEKRIFLEDMLFYSKLCLKQLRCIYVPQIRFYAYRKNESSVSYNANPQKLSDSFSMCDIFHSFSRETSNQRLQKIYQLYSLKIYRSTLQTLSLDEYYDAHKKYVQLFELYKLRNRIISWMKEYKKVNMSLVYFISPLLSIQYFRFKLKLARIKYMLKKYIKTKYKNE